MINYFLIYWMLGIIGSSVELKKILDEEKEEHADIIGRISNLSYYLGESTLYLIVIISGLVYIPGKIGSLITGVLK